MSSYESGSFKALVFHLVRLGKRILTVNIRSICLMKAHGAQEQSTKYRIQQVMVRSSRSRQLSMFQDSSTGWTYTLFHAQDNERKVINGDRSEGNKSWLDRYAVLAPLQDLNPRLTVKEKREYQGEDDGKKCITLVSVSVSVSVMWWLTGHISRDAQK